MGIKGLMKLISDNAPCAVKEKEIKSYFGLKVAIDASMALYQFLVAIRAGPDDTNLTNEAGEMTSHLSGMFYRTIRMMENGIKPVWVFDGKPPDMKGGELLKRKERREEAEAELKKAQEEENKEDEHKFNRRLVRVSKEHNDDVKALLRLMGVPVVEAPGEAEAQCAALAKADKVFATATEDMDALTFGTPKLLRNLSASAARKLPILQIDLAVLLQDIGLTMEQFIDVCILCGCDYTGTIRGIGSKRALELILKHGNIEKAIESLDKKKYTIPDNFQFKESRALFVKPDIDEAAKVDLKWKDPDEKGLIDFMVNNKGFQIERIQTGIKRIKACRGKGTQKRMESFFGSVGGPRKRVAPPAKGKGKKGSKKKGPASKKAKKK